MRAAFKMHTILSFSLALVACVQACSHVADRDKQYAPVPVMAQGLPISSDTGYAVQPLGQGLYMVTDGFYESMFAVSDTGVILVDAPGTMLTKLPPAIGNITSQPITHMVYSHHHADHLDSAGALVNANTTIIAHDLTQVQLNNVPHPTRPDPTVTFAENYTLCVGNQTFELSYQGENHAQGNIFIYAPAQKALMIVDIFDPGWTPFAQLGIASDIPGYVLAQTQTLAYDFEHIVTGHVNRAGTRQDVEDNVAYVQDLFDNCNATMHLPEGDPNSQASISADVLSKNPGNMYAVEKTYIDIVAEICGNKTAETWLGRLGGADVFAFENAWRAVTSLLEDYA